METQNCMHCGTKIDERGMNGYCSTCLSWCADSFLPGQIEKRTLRGSKKCIVKDCENTSDLGRFIGDLCSPCHATLIGKGGEFSQLYRNMKEGTKVNVKMVLMSEKLSNDRMVLTKAVKLPHIPRKEDRFSVTNKFGKAVFQVDNVEWDLKGVPTCYCFGVGVASTTFGQDVLIEDGWFRETIQFFSVPSKEYSSQSESSPTIPKLRDDIEKFIQLLNESRLSPTKQNHSGFGRYTAVWHTDNDSERWVRAETLTNTPGFLLLYFDSVNGIKMEMTFEKSVVRAVFWIKDNVRELGKIRSPWFR